MAKAFVNVSISAVIEYDTDLFDEDEVVSKSVICFYSEDKSGVENFLPKENGLEVIDYLNTDGYDVTKEYTEE